MTPRATAVAYATLPPPVTGLSLATKSFLDVTSHAIDWSIHSVGRDSPHRHRGQVSRLLKNAKAMVGCVARTSRTPIPSYMPVSAGATMVYNIGLTAACGARRSPVVLHHHSYAYVDRYSRSMAALNGLLTPNDMHIFLSDCMRESFDKLYGRAAQSVTLPYSYTLTRDVSTGLLDRKPGPYRIGHLSNLTIEKGLQTVMDAFGELQKIGCPCELHLAGPTYNDRERLIVQKARETFGSALIHHGPVFDEKKDAFFRNIDCFWFPTEYVNEAQPIVLVEATSYGVPCVAMNRGCIQWLLGDAGLVLDTREEFIAVAVEQARIHSSSSDFEKCRDACLKRLAEIREVEKRGMESAIGFLAKCDATNEVNA